MASTIRHKRSSTPGAAPTTVQLQLGELAVNTFDGRLFFKKDVSGAESIIEPAMLHGGGGMVQVANTISVSVSIDASRNGFSPGPISVATGVTVTVPTGCAWVIV